MPFFGVVIVRINISFQLLKIKKKKISKNKSKLFFSYNSLTSGCSISFSTSSSFSSFISFLMFCLKFFLRLSTRSNLFWKSLEDIGGSPPSRASFLTSSNSSSFSSSVSVSVSVPFIICGQCVCWRKKCDVFLKKASKIKKKIMI